MILLLFFTLALNGNIGNRIPYKKMPLLNKKEFIQKRFGIFAKRNINETIRER